MKQNSSLFRHAITLVLTLFLLATAFILTSCSRHPHTLIKIERKEPTCTEIGNILYWNCPECGKNYSDKRGKKEITDFIIPAQGHTFAEGICTVCGIPEPSKGLQIFFSPDNTFCVVSGIGTCTDTEIIIPDFFNGIPVTGIGDHAFSNCSEITSIEIPDSITSIGSNAFNKCTSLVYNEYDNAFYLGNRENPFSVLVKAKSDDTNVSCLINENTKALADEAFMNCQYLKSVTFAENSQLRVIGNYAFSNASSLKSIALPEGVTSIGESAFSNCQSLETISMSGNVKSIGVYAFKNCTSLVFNEYDNAKYLGNSNNAYIVLTEAKSEDITSCYINDSAVIIYPYAFSDCNLLTKINIPDKIKTIGAEAFLDCKSLKEVHINDMAVWCTIDFESGNSNPLNFAENLYLDGEIVNEPVIPNSVTNIKDYAFYGWETLTRITIPNSVRSIGKEAFYGCCTVTRIILPDSLTTVGENAFYGCSSLVYNEYEGGKYLKSNSSPYALLAEAVSKDIVSCHIHKDTRIIYNSAFKDCTNLKNVTFDTGSQLISINDYAFSGCTSVESLVFGENSQLSVIGNYAFEGCKSLDILTFGKNSNLRSIGNRAFSDCPTLDTLIFGENSSLETIGNYAFNNCVSLLDIAIPNNVRFIGVCAFYGCRWMETVDFENKKGWTAGNNSISDTDLTDTETAAEYLCRIYNARYWVRH